MIDLKFCTHSSNRLLRKSMPKIFLIMSYSAFAAILWQILKSYFERKRSKRDYPKNIWKEEKCVHGFFGSWLYVFQWEKTIENCICVGAGARKVENLVRFLSNFDPYFPNTRRVRKRCIIYWKYWNILQKYWKYWKHGSNNAWKQRITLSFCLKGTLIPNNSVQLYDSVEWQKRLILMRRGRKVKLPKLVKVN